MVENTFDAVRNENALFVDTSIQLDSKQATYPQSVCLNESNWDEFVANTSEEQILVLFGNNKNQRNLMHQRLEENGFTQIYNAGTLEELNYIKNT